MSNRYMNQFGLTLEKQTVSLYARVTFGSTGAPTLVAAQSKGIKSITRNSAGLYTIVMGTVNGSIDLYYKLLMITHRFDESSNSGTAPVAPLMYIVANSSGTVGTGSVQIKFTAVDGTTATDPASTEAVLLELVFSNSNAP